MCLARETEEALTGKAVRFAIGEETRELLRHALPLISHKNPSGDLAALFQEALEALVEKLEKRKEGRIIAAGRGRTISTAGAGRSRRPARHAAALA